MSRSPHLRSDPLRTYRDATGFLESLVRTPPRTRDERERLGLSPIESLLDRIGNPHRRLAAIHIAGSKGKGSTALYIEALLSAAGLRTGTFTSPHLEDWNERIRVAGSPIDRPRLVEALERVRPAIAELHRADADSAPAFFDALVAAAFSVFADARVDFAVVEAGIGARLDPTRVCRAVATCVTGVELEHTERLGSTIADIAREKAAVVRPGIPLVTGSMPEAARVVLEHEAARAGAPQRRLGREITIRRGDTLPSTNAAPNDSGRHSRRGRTAAPAGPVRDTGVVEIVLPRPGDCGRAPATGTAHGRDRGAPRLRSRTRSERCAGWTTRRRAPHWKRRFCPDVRKCSGRLRSSLPTALIPVRRSRLWSRRSPPGPPRNSWRSCR